MHVQTVSASCPGEPAPGRLRSGRASPEGASCGPGASVASNWSKPARATRRRHDRGEQTPKSSRFCRMCSGARGVSSACPARPWECQAPGLQTGAPACPASRPWTWPRGPSSSDGHRAGAATLPSPGGLRGCLSVSTECSLLPLLPVCPGSQKARRWSNPRPQMPHSPSECDTHRPVWPRPCHPCSRIYSGMTHCWEGRPGDPAVPGLPEPRDAGAPESRARASPDIGTPPPTADRGWEHEGRCPAGTAPCRMAKGSRGPG